MRSSTTMSGESAMSDSKAARNPFVNETKGWTPYERVKVVLLGVVGVVRIITIVGACARWRVCALLRSARRAPL